MTLALAVTRRKKILHRIDTVLRTAAAGFYQLRWSAEILDEMERNLVSKGIVSADKAARLRATMEKYFPEAQVTDYEPLIPA